MSTTAQWLEVAAFADIPADRSFSVHTPNCEIILLRCDNEVYALEDRCTHDGEPLQGAEVADCQVICPRHGARFCARSGEALTPPAYEAIRTFETRVENGRVYVRHIP